MFPVNRFRDQVESPDGHLISSTGLRIPVSRLSINRDGEWWGGQLRLYPGDTIERGAFQLAMNDGRVTALSIDEIHTAHFGGVGMTTAAFHGIGPAP